MEEKKKRVRPTLTQVRQLESELESVREELRLARREMDNMRRDAADDSVSRRFYDSEIERHMDDKSRLVADCDGWRDKYRFLADTCATMEKANGLMEEEIKRLSSARDTAVKRCQELIQEINNIKNRGFWSRVINRNF